MFNSAMKWLAVVACVLVLSGCAARRTMLLGGLPDTVPAPMQAAVDREAQAMLDRLYAQGAAALVRDDLDAATAAWRQYANIAAPQLARTRKVRGYLTLMGRETARRFARQVAAGERQRAFVPTDRLHVAVFPFLNQAPNAAGPADASFNRAVMAMISTDLVQVPSLTVLERDKIDLVLQELKLADSGLVDPATASAPGHLLGAGTVIVGSVTNEAGPGGPGSGRYSINTVVSDVHDGSVIGVQEAAGGQREFHALQKSIVYGILETLQIKDFPAAVRRIHTRSWDAYARFATGLKRLDEDRFDDARQAFREALVFDPGFALAEQALLDTPEQGATFEGVQRALRSGT